ncbi:rhizopuspepsin 2 precursor [Halteromyces radiatus]|uniref:rhizopuspepsin 2 precursor n=1 Tax=Halteromyces radiatus TaxID=101107 RepID=UPI00221F7980|nr:rhizopuspepsin 2 precursor [Halteromyces radiatus]KAI8088639.1 rhizopuspepsin 2 precursor [Halteromyces radiatus]
MQLYTYASLLLASVALIQAAPVADQHLSFPLEANPHYVKNATRSLLKAQAKYARFSVSAQSSAGTVPMTDYGNDVEYYGTVEFGTPPQKLQLDFDTGSSDLWIASTLCSGCSSRQHKYDPSKSSTYKKEGKPWKISYGDGSHANGVTGIDTVTLGGLAIKNQRIELAQQESSSFAQGPNDGLLGLGFNTIASVPNTKTPVDNLIAQNLISKPIFGVYLGKKSTGGGGEYVFGGINNDHVGGKFTTVNVDPSQGFWSIKVDGFSVGSGPSRNPFNAIVDTGTTLILLEDSVAQALGQAYGGQQNSDGTFTIPCSTPKDLTFSIAGTKFVVPGKDIIFQNEGSTCYAGFASAGSIPFAILGDVFLKNVYTVFEQSSSPTVQFAPVK